MSAEAREADFVLNVVVTPGTFRYLEPFTRSLALHGGTRLRLVANGCPPDDVERMLSFAAEPAARAEVLELPGPAMVPHGAALDEVYAARDDGDHFCFIDSDVLARGAFMAPFVDALAQAGAVTSCNVAWSTDTVLPAGAADLVGRHVVGHDGFVYGSSFCALYSRPAVEHVRAKWGVTFRAGAHAALAEPVQHRLEELGRRFTLYDTAKVLNILFQGEGYELRYLDNPALFHIGGISQYLSDPTVRDAPPGAGAPVPWHSAAGAGRVRWDFARWAAATLRALVDGGVPPELPGDARRPAAEAVRDELQRLVPRAGG